MLEAAIGDAYGAGFEFREIDFIKKHNDLTRYIPHGLYQEIYKRYTDDTQMAIAVAELLLEDADWSEMSVADKFVATFHRDKRRGYSDRVYNALDASVSGKDFIRIIDNSSSGNGSAMRAYPLGFIKDVAQLLEYSKIQAIVSHNTTEGIVSAQRIALSVHYYRYGLDRELSLPDFINYSLKENTRYEIVSPIDMKGHPTTKAVIALVSAATSMQQCLKEGTDYGGDTDTVAALSLAILSQKRSCDKMLPSFLSQELENGEFGGDYLKMLDARLEKRFTQ
jgi:ADP-ribosyl-[dinitrogen reductase] hydrolase